MWSRLEFVPEWRHDEPDPGQHQAIEVSVPGGVMMLWSRAGRWANLGMYGQCLADYHGGTVAERGWRPAMPA